MISDGKSVFFKEETTEKDRKIYKVFAILLGIDIFVMLFPFLELVNSVRPFIFGLPLLYGWVAIAIIIQFGLLISLYTWESRREK